MWPLLVLSVVALTVVFERFIVIARERVTRSANYHEPTGSTDIGIP